MHLLSVVSFLLSEIEQFTFQDIFWGIEFYKCAFKIYLPKEKNFLMFNLAII